LTNAVVLGSKKLLIDIHLHVKILWGKHILLFLIFESFLDLEQTVTNGLEGFSSLGLVIEDVIEFHFVVFRGYCWNLG